VLLRALAKALVDVARLAVTTASDGLSVNLFRGRYGPPGRSRSSLSLMRETEDGLELMPSLLN